MSKILIQWLGNAIIAAVAVCVLRYAPPPLTTPDAEREREEYMHRFAVRAAVYSFAKNHPELVAEGNREALQNEMLGAALDSSSGWASLNRMINRELFRDDPPATPSGTRPTQSEKKQDDAV